MPVLSTQICPPIASTNCLLIYNTRPGILHADAHFRCIVTLASCTDDNWCAIRRVLESVRNQIAQHLTYIQSVYPYNELPENIQLNAVFLLLELCMGSKVSNCILHHCLNSYLLYVVCIHALAG